MTSAPTIHFSHSAYALSDRYALRGSPNPHFQTWTKDDLATRIGDSEVLVLSGFWDNALLSRATRLKYIHVCAVGYDQFDRAALSAAGVKLTNSSGVNANAVSEQAMGFILNFQRYLHLGRDNQRNRFWRPMISDFRTREDELPGKTVVIYGLGTIGQRIARLSRAFGMKTIGIRRNIAAGADSVDEIYPPESFEQVLPRADFVVLACPLTDSTRDLMNPTTLGLMHEGAYLINVARGGCVDQSALIDALSKERIAGAALDVTTPEPLESDSPLWGFDNVILTPHTGGETRKYEDNVIDVLVENLKRLDKGDELLNAIV